MPLIPPPCFYFLYPPSHPQLCFVNDPICDTTMYWFEFTVEAIFIFDIFVNFRTGFFLESIGSSSNIEELQVEYGPG